VFLQLPNNTNLTCTSDSIVDLQKIVGGLGHNLEFRTVTGGDEALGGTTFIFRGGQNMPIGWQTTYLIPEAMTPGKQQTVAA
jgi:hypothetical protein